MTTEERFALYCELISCKYPLRYWRYGRDFELLEANCEDAQLWQRVFEAGGMLPELRSHFGKSDRPLLLDLQLGILCGAACTADSIYVLGPVRGLDGNLRVIAEMIRTMVSEAHTHMDQSASFLFQNKLIDAFSRLPVIFALDFCSDVAMLHCCLTRERMERSAVVLLQRDPADVLPREKQPMRDRHQTWMAEQALLRAVREGDLNFKAALSHSANVSRGVPVQSKDPMQRARFSCVTFIALCTRAAIEGGLTPEHAYTVGDGYLQQVEDALTTSELIAINHRMFEDFITRVHNSRANPRVTPQLQACRDYIELHLEEPLPLEELSKRVGYSSYYLSRKFKEELGISINDYIKCVRVERAKLELISTDDAIRDIAKRLQFCSESYFSRVFQQVAGVKPQQYRKQHQKP